MCVKWRCHPHRSGLCVVSGRFPGCVCVCVCVWCVNVDVTPTGYRKAVWSQPFLCAHARERKKKGTALRVVPRMFVCGQMLRNFRARVRACIRTYVSINVRERREKPYRIAVKGIANGQQHPLLTEFWAQILYRSVCIPCFSTLTKFTEVCSYFGAAWHYKGFQKL